MYLLRKYRMSAEANDLRRQLFDDPMLFHDLNDAFFYVNQLGDGMIGWEFDYRNETMKGVWQADGDEWVYRIDEL